MPGMKIFITGSIATGKTTLAKALRDTTGYQYINIGDLVVQNQLFNQYDDQYNCYVQDDDLLLQYFRQHLQLQENVIIDHHDSEIFGCDYFDLVV